MAQLDSLGGDIRDINRSMNVAADSSVGRYKLKNIKSNQHPDNYKEI